MKINGSFTIRFRREGTTITFYDRDANIDFASIKVVPEDMLEAMGGLGYAPCEMNVYSLDKVGKKMENKKFEFEIPDELYSSTKSYELFNLAKALVPDGWMPDSYFSSQDSFFRKDGVQYARCTIRRWVDKSND